MESGARTPEELETLMEDAFLLRDRERLEELFEHGAVLAPGSGHRGVLGGEQIARALISMWDGDGALWDGDGAYLADPRRVLQAGDTALVIAKCRINVVRRGSDGAWRYAISLLASNHQTEGNTNDAESE